MKALVNNLKNPLVPYTIGQVMVMAFWFVSDKTQLSTLLVVLVVEAYLIQRLIFSSIRAGRSR